MDEGAGSVTNAQDESHHVGTGVIDRRSNGLIRENTVELVRWPAESARRQRYHRTRTPCLLVVEGGAAAPLCRDPWEDWVRAPISARDLDIRIAAIEERVSANPRLDASGLLRFRGQSTEVSATQFTLLEPLVTAFGKVILREVLHARLRTPRRSRPSRNALDLQILRLRQRVDPLGLVISTAWGRGYALESASTG
jgi:hypothetical protein